jgi:hypothetical protein
VVMLQRGFLHLSQPQLITVGVAPRFERAAIMMTVTKSSALVTCSRIKKLYAFLLLTTGRRSSRVILASRKCYNPTCHRYRANLMRCDQCEACICFASHCCASVVDVIPGTRLLKKSANVETLPPASIIFTTLRLVLQTVLRITLQ